MIDTTRLLSRISEALEKPVLLSSYSKALIGDCEDAIKQLIDRIESERRKSALADERVELLHSEIDDGK